MLTTVFKHLLICFHWLSLPEACNWMCVSVLVCVCACAEICGECLIIWLYMFILIHPSGGLCEARRNQAPATPAISGMRNSPHLFTHCLVFHITSARPFIICHLSHNTWFYFIHFTIFTHYPTPDDAEYGSSRCFNCSK